MKTIHNILTALSVLVLTSACQNMDYEIATPALAPIDASLINGVLQGDDYVWTWTAPAGKGMEVSLYNGSAFLGSETISGNSYAHRNVDTNVEYTYVFKLTDGTNLSSGVIKRYTRPGASRMEGLSMTQVETASGFDAHVEWLPNASAEQVLFSATNGQRDINETLQANVTEYTIPNVNFGEEWTVTITGRNTLGASLPLTASLKIGKTAIGFLSVYPTPEDLVEKGDDDEASAWLWLQEEYPSARFVYFGDVNSVDDIDRFRVLFWLRDLESTEENELTEDDVFAMPDVVAAATPSIKEWYAAGGSMLLWSHATVYVGALGRLPMNVLRNNGHVISLGTGGYNGDVWSMAVSLNPGMKFTRDHSTHPIYRGMTVVSNDRCKLIPFKGAGWTEDHNCLFFDIPTALTGLGNQEEECYTQLTKNYGIYPLGTWDSQIDFVSQLNVWEAQQGNTEFKGTLLCIGNGGCEFSMKNPDGTPDKSAHPTNNPYQDNVLKLAKNSLEYLKTR